MKKLRVLDLFSGIGGFSLGLERTGGFETVAFCEIEPFCQRVLKKHWPEVPCFEDVRMLARKDINGPVDVICGGYPCQPFSTAGQRRGAEDDRHLWPEVNRLLDEFRPSWFIGENVAGHVSMGLDSVLSDLETKGYTARPFIIPACAVDAKHRRDRIWIVANASVNRRGEGRETGYLHQKDGGSNGQMRREPRRTGEQSKDMATKRETLGHANRQRQLQSQGAERDQWGRLGNTGKVVADAIGGRQQRQREFVIASNQTEASKRQAVESFNGRFGRKWGAEPSVGRVANGIPNRVDRLKALGNAVVPQIPELIGHAILEAMQERLAA